MKKKLLFSIVMLFAVSLFVIRVNAANALLNIPFEIEDKAPDNPPSTTDVLYGASTDNFDFSKVKFAPASGSEDIAGKKDFRKIVLGKLNNSINTEVDFNLENTFDSWFTAYCLDNLKKYPEYGILNSKAFNSTSDANLKVDEVVLAAVGQDATILSKIKSNSNLNSGGITSIQVTAVNPSNEVTARYYELSDPDTSSALLSRVEDLNVSITVKLQKVSFYKGATEYALTAADITGNSSATTYDLTFKGKDILLEKYNVTDYRNVSGYDHALWIIEHSYPTLGLKATVEASGANYDALRKQICELEGFSFDDDTLTCNGISNDKFNSYVRSYVYATVQYAIWKSTNLGVGQSIGGSIKNVSELNTLYQYLIQDRSEYNGYSSKEFTNKITVSGPKEGKELYKETSNTYVYGPFTAKYDVLAGGKMELSIKNTDKTGIKLVNEDGDEITKLSNGGKFFIECTKAAKVSSVSVVVKLNDASVFEPLTKRGRIYYPKYVVEQNLMSGGKIINKDLEAKLELVVNPKTGVENVALLLMVTLVAFTLAYLVLSYKQKPIQLNK